MSDALCKHCNKRKVISEFYAVCRECQYHLGRRKSIGEKIDQLGTNPKIAEAPIVFNKIEDIKETLEIASQEPERKISWRIDDVKRNLGIIAIVGFWLFAGWIFLSGFFSSNDYDATHTIRIDCSNPDLAVNNKYCNGTYQSDINQQEYNENSYYQNIVR